jgi:hypothetical protein
MAEWETLFHVIDRSLREMDFASLWAHLLIKIPAAEFTHIKPLVYVRMVMQLTSAVNERGFSRLKLIKSDLRTCLNDDLLDWLMMITIEGPDVRDHEAVRALCLRAMRSWLQLKQRVPSRGNPGAKRKRVSAQDDGEESLLDILASTNETALGSAPSTQAAQFSLKPNYALAKSALPAAFASLTIYHIFDEIGWCRGKVRGKQVKTGDKTGYYTVAYAAGDYGGHVWKKTEVTHALKLEDYDLIWVIVEATDKACFGRVKS